MLIILHNYKKVLAVKKDAMDFSIDYSTLSIGSVVYLLAEQYPDEIISWCFLERFSDLNTVYINESFLNNRYFFSYNSNGNYFPNALGYVDQSPFIKINKEVLYPTWQMSSEVGAVKASTVLIVEKKYWSKNETFDYVLTSIAKLYQPLGLFCYSNPHLLKHSSKKIETTNKAPYSSLFKFVKEHYKWIWIYLLLLSVVLYEGRFKGFSWFKTFGKSQIKLSENPLGFDDSIAAIGIANTTIDVIIPTIGRKKYLLDVLKDLNEQTHLPENVIIVEQNPVVGSVSELDYLSSEHWSFQIKHVFTHQTGACNARNIALALVESEYCFFNDDDNRFAADLISTAIFQMKSLNVKALLTSYIQKDEILTYKHISQTTIFGSGNAFLLSEVIKDIKFNMILEFGYGEDTEFGLQLRNKGVDVIYFPNLSIIHLKAPFGGFRTKFSHPWEHEKIVPVPSPTVMFVKQKFYTKSQLLGYKTSLFLKLYKIKLYKLHLFLKQWKQSQKWTNYLIENDQ